MIVKATYLKFALPIALLTASLAFGDEMTEQPLVVEQKDKNNYSRTSLDFDIFWAPASFNSYYPIYNEYGQHIGNHRHHGKQTSRYEGGRLTWEWLEPNNLYAGINLWLAGGEIHQIAYINDKKLADKTTGSNFWLNTDTSLGYNFKPSPDSGFLLSVFAGPGYHYERKFHHDVRWNYGLAGFKISQYVTKSLSLGVDFKTMYSYNVWDPHRVTDFERKGNRHFWGIELGTPVTWHFGKKQRFDLQIKPYVLKYNLNSNVTILGTTIGLGYTF